MNIPTKIYIIGVNHHIQHNGRCPADERLKPLDHLRSEFRVFILEQIGKYIPDLLAEEFNGEALKQRKVDASILSDIGMKMNIKHAFVDPNSDERKTLGIYNDESEYCETQGNRMLKYSEIDRAMQDSKSKREEYWFEHILAEHPKIIVFVRGAEHIDTFASSTKQKGWDTFIINAYYEETKYNILISKGC